MYKILLLLLCFYLLIFIYLYLYKIRENYQNSVSATISKGERVATNIYDYPTANLDIEHDIP